MKTRSMFALCLAMLLPLFTFAADLVSDYTVSEDGTTYTRSEGWSALEVGMTIVMKYENLPAEDDAFIMTLSQYAPNGDESKVGLCSRTRLPRGTWNGVYWNNAQNASTALLGESGVVVCVYKPVGGDNNQGLLAYDSSGALIFSANKLKSSASGSTVGKKIVFTDYVTDVAIYKGAIAAEAIPALVTAINQPVATSVYESFLTTEYVKTTIRAESIEDLLAASYSGTMKGGNIGNGGSAEASGYFVTKSSDNELTVELQAINGETKCVLLKLMLDDEGYISVMAVKAAWMATGTSLGTRFFNNEVKVDSANNATVVTSTTAKGYGIAELTIVGKNVGDTTIPAGTLKYGYDFAGTSFTKEEDAADSLSAAKPATIIASQANGALILGNNAGSHYGDSGFSYGEGNWSIAAVFMAPGEGEVVYAMGGQKGTTGLIGLRNAGDNTIEAFTANAAKVTSTTPDEDPKTAYHLYTIVYSSGKLRMNVDGGPFTDEVDFTTGTGVRWQFGGIHGGISGLSGVNNASNDQGALEEFRVYTTALNREQTYKIAEEFGLVGAEDAPVYNPETDTVATTPVLRFSEIMPKPSDKPNSITTEAGYDKNGLESGWVELENTSETEWADLADYKFIRTNRSKANDKGDYGAFPSVKIPPKSKYVFYTSERYSNSASKADSAFAEGSFDGAPKYFEEYDMMIWGDKINPKKFPFVRLYFKATIVDTVVIPSDIPEGNSIIVTPVEEGKATIRYMTSAPTCGKANPTDLDKLVKLGPNVGPLYEIANGASHKAASEFGATPPAKAGEDYVINFSLNPTMSPTVSAGFRDEDKLKSVKLIYRTWGLDEKGEAAQTSHEPIVVTAEPTWDAKDQGSKYTVLIPAANLPSAGQLVQWKFEVVDASGNTWTTPSFHNPDDGYEWYGTIVEPDASQISAKLPTWHMFVDSASKAQMDVDSSVQTLANNARVAIYDNSTSNYYDYVRIDLRGNTSAHFNKKSHGLRFSKAHPLTIYDPVRKTTWKEIRKSSLIGEPADPSRVRQMTAFWLWDKMGNKVPFDFPIRCNLNGEFYQLGFHSERFTDELIEDVYGLDKYGYSYKNVGNLKSNGSTTAGGIEKKTPDDGKENDISVLQKEFRAKITAADNVKSSTDGKESTGLDDSELTKFVVQKFDLPAWINYLASARITKETDDVWANISIYYDNAQMLEGVRGTGTWMPLGYDFNLSFGQYYSTSYPGMRADTDWHKAHPFYGGNRIRCYNDSNYSGFENTGNNAIEAVLQNAKFRRLYLRRLRTLMDQELKEPGTAEAQVPFMAKMREFAEMMREDAELDLKKYSDAGYENGWSSSIKNNDVWGARNWPNGIDAGVNDIWENYTQPRQTHLYVTHAAEGHTEDQIGYASTLCSGIPAAQSQISQLKGGISVNAYSTDFGQYAVIENTNEETIDMSGWKLSGPVSMTLPPGTVIDAMIGGLSGKLYVVVDRRSFVTNMERVLSDQIIIGNGVAGDVDSSISLRTATGERVVGEPSEQEKSLRLFGFCGVPNGDAGTDVGEFVILTNLNQTAELDISGAIIHFNKNGAALDARAKITLPAGAKIAAGGWLRLEQSWEKITDGNIDIWLYDNNGSTISEWTNVPQSSLGVKATGYYAKYDFAADAWTKDLIENAPGYVAPEPPPVDPVDPVEGEVLEGEFADPVELGAGSYVLSNATFTAGLTLTGATTLATYPNTVNRISNLTAAGALTLSGSGTLTLSGTPTLTTNLMKVTGDLIVESGTFNIVAEGPEPVVDTDKFAAVLVTGKFLQTGGTVNVELSGTKVYGISLDTKNTTATIEGGAFNATIGGTSCSALKLKGSCTGSFKGGVITGVLVGAGAKIFNGGSQTYSGGEYTVTMPVEATEATGVKPFCADRTLVISDGMFDIKIPTEGSEAISTAGDGDKTADLTISGGVIKIEAGDDPINSAMDINITGGFVHAVSTKSDALDANGSMSITGGYVFAFTKSSEHEALDVIPAEDNGLTHTLTIGKDAVVLAVGGKQVGEIAGDAAILKVDEETEAKSQKYVIFTIATTDAEAMAKTTKSYAVNWTGKHIGEIGDGSKFAIMIAAEEIVGDYTKGKNPSDTDTEYQPLEPSYDKILVKTVSVEDITPPSKYPEGALVITEVGEYDAMIADYEDGTPKKVIVDVGEGNTVTFTQGNSFTGGLEIWSGTAAQTYESKNNSKLGGFGANNYDTKVYSTVRVEAGAMLDLGKTTDACYAVTTAGDLVNSVGEIGTGSRQMSKLTLEGDVTASGYQFGLLAPSYDPTELDMNRHTLTVDISGGQNNQFILSNTTVKNSGVIKLVNGKLWLNKALNGSVKLDLSEFTKEGGVVAVRGTDKDTTDDIFNSITLAANQTGWTLSVVNSQLVATYVAPPEYAEEDETAEEVGLMISEIMPKASVWDENHCDSGWLEVVNTSTKNVQFADYTIARFNRGKSVAKLTGWVNGVTKLLAPGERLVIKTSEDYPHADDKTITQYEDMDGVIVLAAKINPKKYPLVVLAKNGAVVQNCIVPVDVPEDKSVVFECEDLNGAKVSYIANPTKGAAPDLAKAVPVGPQITSLYAVDKATDPWIAFPQAKPGEAYQVSVPVNPVYDGNELNAITKVQLIYQIGWGAVVTNEVAMTKSEIADPLNGDIYTDTIPAEAIMGDGQLVRFAVKITDAAGNEWRSPSFNNPEDGYEWYGTITTPNEDQTKGKITTLHLFAPDGVADIPGSAKRPSTVPLMNIDADDAAFKTAEHPYGAYVGIYDSDTGMYYDKVRIDKRGNTSGAFTKKAHGLKFAKAQPFTGVDSVTGEKLSGIRKSSFTAEYGDPSFVRQELAFKTLNDNGSKAPFHYPVRLNLNGEFYQLAFHTERFSDELIEDLYGLDPKGYGYKNVGSFNPNLKSVTGGIEKKTPDDGVVSDGGVLKEFCNKMSACDDISELYTSGVVEATPDSAFETEFSSELTKVVAEDFDLPAWLNYIALTKITGETDDVWGNISAYYDINKTGTWMPLAYDMNQSLGDWHIGDDRAYASRYADGSGLCPANDDHSKAHPLYGGLHIMVHYSGGAPYSKANNGTTAVKPYKGNRCFESIFQNAKYRRLYLRRLRTLMDAEFGGIDAAKEDTPIYRRAAEMVARYSEVAAMDRAIWTDYVSSTAAIWIWGNRTFTAEEGLEEMWENYIVPRRQHLYVTHGVADPKAKGIGYGEKLCAGIPEAQSSVESLKAGFSATYDAALEAMVIKNTNNEVVDMSGWELVGPVVMTLPAGTVIDQGTEEDPGIVYIAVDRKATIAKMTITDQVVIGNAAKGSVYAPIGLAAGETEVIPLPPPTEQATNIAIYGICGAPATGNDGEGEFVILTNTGKSEVDLGGLKINVCKQADLDSASKCSITVVEGTRLGAGEYLRLEKKDSGAKFTGKWTKITDGDLRVLLTDSTGIVYYAYEPLSQELLGLKGVDMFALHNLKKDTWKAEPIENAPGYVAPTKTWEEATEITDETPMNELLPEAQATTLENLGVKPTTLANWAKTHHAADTLGTEINLVAFALDCAPEEVETKKEDFKVTITFGEDGTPVVETVEGVTLNITPVIKGKVELSDENWTEACEGAKFFRAFIDIK